MNETIPLRPTIAGVEIPIACDLGAIPDAERKAHFDLSERLFGEYVRERLEEADSVAFRFDAEAYPLVVRFVDNERLCCAFMTFAITVYPARGDVWLRVWGDADVRQAMLDMGVAFP